MLGGASGDGRIFEEKRGLLAIVKAIACE